MYNYINRLKKKFDSINANKHAINIALIQDENI